MRILVVDDSSTMVRIITNSLKRLNHNDNEPAEDGQIALEKYNKFKADEKPFDLIITDWNMPNMNGLEFVKEVRKVNQDIPIIMVTTEGGKTEVITALKAGVNNYIVKPFTPAVLKEKLKAVIGEG